MIIMAVDFGTARTGVAVSDASETMAFPKTVVTEYNPEKRIEKLAALAKEFGAGLLVAGLPRNMDGSEGFKAEECRENALRLAEAAGLPVELYDERCTTVMAHKTLSDNNVRGKKRKDTVDAVAAVYILEGYLSYRKNQPNGAVTAAPKDPSAV